MLAQKNNKVLIIGPSHVVRWKYFISKSVFPNVEEHIDFIGKAGCPIWHESIMSEIDNYNEYKEVFIIVGDFRFGNSFLEDGKLNESFGISKRHISLENDNELYQKSLEALILISQKLKGKIKFIFWDLIFRENKNRLKDKYSNDGEYKHPVWNYLKVQQIFCNCSIDFTEVISNESLAGFFIDNSNHPTMVGYSFILACALEGKANKVISDEMISRFIGVSECFSYKSEKKVLITGDTDDLKYTSSFLRFLINYHKKRSFHLSNTFISRTFDEGILKRESIERVQIISSLNSNDSLSVRAIKIEKLFLILNQLHEFGLDVKVLFWEELVNDAFTRHSSELFNLLATDYKSQKINILRLNIVDEIDPYMLIEKNKAMQPTFFSISNYLRYTSLATASLYVPIKRSEYISNFNQYFKNLNLPIFFDRVHSIIEEKPTINNEAKLLISKGEWHRAVDLLSTNVDSSGENKIIKKIIYNKDFRPIALSEQADLLKEIHLNKSFSLYHRLNSLTAYSHKIMEGMLDEHVDEAISLILDNLTKIELISYSDYIREDQNHIRFSMLTVLWHLHLFKGDINSFLDVGEVCYLEFESLNEKTLTKGFYQTSTNLVRCLCVMYLRSCLLKDIKLEEKIYLLIEKALWLGLVHSDDHKVKFSEYLGIMSSYSVIKRYRKIFRDSSTNFNLFKKGTEELVLSFIRSHGKDKVQRIKSNIELIHEISLRPQVDK